MLISAQILVVILTTWFIAIFPYFTYSVWKNEDTNKNIRITTFVSFILISLFGIFTLIFILLINTTTIELKNLNLYDLIMIISIANISIMTIAILIASYFLLAMKFAITRSLSIKIKWNHYLNYWEKIIQVLLTFLLIIVFILMTIQPATKSNNSEDFFNSKLYKNLVTLIYIPIILSSTFIAKKIVWDFIYLNFKYKQPWTINMKVLLDISVWLLSLISYVIYYIGLSSFNSETWIGIEFYDWILVNYTNELTYFLAMMFSISIAILVFQAINFIHIKNIQTKKLESLQIS